MLVLTCKHQWQAMLTTIYEAFESKLGHKNIRLMLEPIGQQLLFDEYQHVEPDSKKADKLIDLINTRIGHRFYYELALTSMAYEPDVLDNLYHMLILGFEFGPNILDMYQYKDVVRNNEIRLRVKNEANSFKEFLRFHLVRDIYIAHFEPKSKIVEYLGFAFQDRMPSENFIIIDDIHREAAIHKKDTDFYIQTLTDEELLLSQKSEEVNDSYTDMWRVFFDTIAIKERINPTCQMSHFPKWARKHAVEFIR